MGKKKAGKEKNTPVASEDENTGQETNLKMKNKKVEHDDIDDIVNEIEEMNIKDTKKKQNVTSKKNSAKPVKIAESESSDESEEDDEEEEEAEVVQVKSKFSAFALMDDDMCDGNDDEDEELEESDDEPAPPPPPPKQNKPAKQEKKNNKKKAKDEDDWDNLDDLIAPPQKDNKKKNKKDKRKAKKNIDEDEDFDKVLEQMKQVDGVQEEETKPEEPAEAAVEMEEEKPVEIEPEPEVVEKKSKKKKKNKAKETVDKSAEGSSDEGANEVQEEPKEEQTTKKKKKKKMTEEEKKKKEEERKKEEEDKLAKSKKAGPNKKMLAALKELQQKEKEEEEKRKKELEELTRREEERIRLEEEKKKLEEERKERKKQKEKEKKERLKAEGKFLTAKQKADQRRAQEMIAHRKAMGLTIPESGEAKKVRLGSKAFLKKKQQNKQEQRSREESEEPSSVTEEAIKEKEESPEPADGSSAPKPVEDGVKDSWDLSSEEEEEEEEEMEVEEEEKTSSASAEVSDEEEDDSAALPEDDVLEEDNTQSARDRVLDRLQKRKVANEKKKDINVLRAPVVCVLGHVDHGKTKILDKLRRTNVQEGEVGGITQQIGATNVPADAIAHQTKMVNDFAVDSLKFPGLLIIDTPGHESFSNLRNRGSSLCDIAILVVDVTQGLQPQTIESIQLLKKKNVPFVVALNKVDRIFEWQSNQHKDFRDVLKGQLQSATNDFEKRMAEAQLALTEQGLNNVLFWENDDLKRVVSLVPTSAITGDGMGNLIALLCDLCQKFIPTQLQFTEELQCIVLEVKTIQGYGTTIDVILINGRLREGDTIILAGTEGVIVTQIRSLLLPKPMKEIRVKGQYDEFKEVKAAQGIKIAAKDLDKAIAGLSLRVAQHEDEVEILREMVEREFSQTMRSIKVSDKGVYVQASTLGALEALLNFFKAKKIPYSGIKVGPVVKRDVMKAAAMLEHDDKYAVILAFDVKVERDAQELADKEGVKIFMEETIYHLGDRYVEYLNEHKKQKQDEFRSVAVFPCKLKIIPTNVYNKRDPIVFGVTVESGLLRTGTVLCVPSKEFLEIGVVASMEFEHKEVDIAKKGVDVCIKVFPSVGHTPKLYGRHFGPTDELVSKISRESINACKEYFRDDLQMSDWKLMSELKKLFKIL